MKISGAGASFIYPLISQWSADYNAATGNKINYQSIGSGGGIAQIKAATIDFGSSDKPLDSSELTKAGLGQFPSAIGGVVPVVNLDNIEPGKLRLTGPCLQIFSWGRSVSGMTQQSSAPIRGYIFPTLKSTSCIVPMALARHSISATIYQKSARNGNRKWVKALQCSGPEASAVKATKV